MLGGVAIRVSPLDGERCNYLTRVLKPTLHTKRNARSSIACMRPKGLSTCGFVGVRYDQRDVVCVEV